MSAPDTARSVSRSRRIARRTINALGSLMLTFAVLALLAMTVGPRMLHYRTATMLTGSMSPGIVPGDIIVDTPERAADIRVGQIITYQIPVEDHRVESHRVVWVHHNADGTALFRTKGDANNGDDPWTAKAGATTVWQVRGVVPAAGAVIRFLREPAVSLLLTRVLPFLIIAFVLVSIWRPRKPAEECEEHAAETKNPELVA
jgi:signal peptidase